MASLGAMSVEITADTSGLQRGTTEARGELSRMDTQADRSSQKLASLGKVAVAAGAAIGAMGAGAKLLEVARQFDVFEAQLKTATGSIDDARKRMKELSDFAASTPFDVSQSIDGFIKLKNLGLDPSIASLESYGNTASAMGKSMNQMIEAVADASTFEFERLKEFGIRASQEADRVIFTFQGVETSVAKNSKAIQKYLMDLGETEFAGAMQDRTESLDGAVSNLADSWDRLFLSVSDQGAGDLIESSARGATNALNALSKNMDAVVDATKAFALVASAGALVKFTPLLHKQTKSMAALAAQTVRTTTAVGAFGTASRIALGPWGLLIAAVGAAAATFISTREEVEDLTEKIDEQAKYVRKATEEYKELNAQGREMFWMKSQQDLINYTKQMGDIDKRIRGLKDSMSSVDSGTRQDIRQQIERLRNEREQVESEYEKIKAAQAKIFEVGMPKKWENPEEENKGESGGGGNNEEELARLRELTQERLQIVRDAGKTELQLHRDKHKEELDILSGARQQKIIGDKEYTELAIQSASRLEEFQKGQLERERERIAGRLETLQEAGKTEQEMMREKHAADLEILREALEQELISKQEYGQLAVESAARMEEQISEKKRREAENRARTEQWAESKIQDMKMQTAQMAVGLLGNIAGESKAAAIAQVALNKGLQIAQIVQSTAAAKMRAMAELGPIAGPPAAASIAVMGATQAGIAAASGLAQAASAGGGGGGGGTSGVSSAVSSGQRKQQAHQEQQERQTQRTLMVQGDFSPNQLFTGDTVRGLIDAIAEQQKDGYTVVV